jgi:hypothetical protein
MNVFPCTLKQANEIVARLHHKPATGHRFSLGVEIENWEIVGACIVGRPVARKTEQYRIAEVTRLVTDGTKNACSILYAAAARAADAMGYWRIQTFTLPSESGASLRAAGWVFEGSSGGGSWTRSTRRRREDQPKEKKFRWSKLLSEGRNLGGKLLPIECVSCGSATGPLHVVDEDYPGWMCEKCSRALARTA